MDYRSVFAVGIITVAAGIPLLPACKAPDPGEITFSPRGGSSNPSDQNGDNTSSGAAVTDAGSSSSSSSSSSGAAADPVFGTDAFKFFDPGDSANAQPSPHAPPMQGQACGQGGCHADGAGGTPAAAGPKWAAAGTVYGDVNGAALAAGTQIEIRVVGPDGTAVTGSSFSPDKDGNFWLDNSGSAFPDGSKVAIRTATTEMKMNTPLTAANNGANCSNTNAGCHGSSSFRIHIP